MKNTCPKCDTTYNVSAAVIGRKFTCKNCGTPVVVTGEGLDYQAPPAKAPAGDAFDFDAEDERKPAKSSAKAPKGRQRDDEDEASVKKEKKKPEADDLDDLPERKPKKGGEKSFVKDFLFFREFAAPLFVKLVFWLAVFGIVVGGLVFALISVLTGTGSGILTAFGVVLVGIPLGLFMVRIYCELILLGFAIYDRLGEVKKLLEKTNPPPPAP